jgi:hypothetical protein
MDVMKWRFARITLVVALLVNVSVLAQNTYASDDCDQLSCFDQDAAGCCDIPATCCDPYGLMGNVELTFMKFLQEGGVADANGDGADFSMHCAPRFELGYMGRCDVGVRSRYWFYDAATTSSASRTVGVDAYNVDLEFFHNRVVGRKTWLEFGLGLRHMHFRQDNQGSSYTISNAFEGWGGTIGLEAKHPFGIGNLYARARWSILLGNENIVNSTESSTTRYTAHDSTVTQTELAMGYEINRDLGCFGTGVFRFGGEWQTWSNVAIGDSVFGGIGNDDVLEDAGFAGLVFRMELRR